MTTEQKDKDGYAKAGIIEHQIRHLIAISPDKYVQLRNKFMNGENPIVIEEVKRTNTVFEIHRID